ncbi:MAG: DUF4412 domain-containing protein [Deltaproteobacteria bacterium]|nr:DUF4412 domain-containing protein [Deltaproteobacteria bacterium]NND30638.1 DUF4412 domain-containing protein [Myxococcales bacterium]MBT8465745.1 DUF4412 domain-containing protein [Deltaproteobacteria bacterium]MBT8482684.1 DUF4412 domain-containing protein [Deltaproteobacteria bacterium]NNK08269.1 DUF4412 domain-containing protein [Myxococcales bacterium]
MRLALSCLVAMLVASPALAFEGVMEASLSSEQGIAARVRARYSKEGDVRMDIQSIDVNGAPARATTLMPSRGESYFSIDHGQKVIVEMPYSTLATASQQVKGSGESANLEIKKLGKATVSGIETRHIRVIDKDNRAVIDLWLTQKYPADLWTRAFRGRNLGLELSDDERSKAMRKYGVKPGFSMKMRVEQAGGVPVVFLVNKVQRAPVPPEVFALPEGYRRMEGSSAPQP